MKNRNAFIETIKTKEGLGCFVLSTLSLIGTLVTSKFVSDDWSYKKIVMYGFGLLMFIGCVVFTQYVGAVQNQISREEAEARSKNNKHKKK